jgi:Pyruvate/2-oxoacid:ferredoxin oxidoreductase gamma subunit
MSRQGYSIGRMETEQERPTFGVLYRHEMECRPPAKPRAQAPELSVKGDLANPLRAAGDSKFQIRDSEKLHIVIAGTAGERVQSSAALLCRAALSVGLYSTQKNDNPVTQGSGFSLSEICLSPQPIEYTGMESVDVVIGVSQDGWNELQANGTLAQLTPRTLLLLDAELEISNVTGRLLRQPFRREATPKRAALAALAFWLGMERVVPRAAWDAVVASLPVERREDVAAALRIGKDLAVQGGVAAA